jgi:alkylhydroperoxidase/carboxymuconolactone decarboxylase family protein YurZ
MSLEVYNKLDPEIAEMVVRLRDFSVFSGGAIPVKYKLLIVLALDASHGSVDGVKAVFREAIKAGATKEEIAEALRVALYVSGAASAYTAAKALGDIF